MASHYPRVQDGYADSASVQPAVGGSRAVGAGGDFEMAGALLTEMISCDAFHISAGSDTEHASLWQLGQNTIDRCKLAHHGSARGGHRGQQLWRDRTNRLN